MLLTGLRVQNYKSYFDTGQITLSPGFNVIVGQNNVGKTALVEAASLTLANVPHRSLRTLPTAWTPLNGHSEVAVTFFLEPPESNQLLRTLGPFVYIRVVGGDGASAVNYLRHTLRSPVRITARWATNRMGFEDATMPEYDPSPSRGPILMANVAITLESEAIGTFTQLVTADSEQDLAFRIAGKLKDRIYFFHAERLNIGQSAIANNDVLAPNAANLAQVLNFLQSNNPERWKRYVRLVRTILPQVAGITVPPVSGARCRS